MENRQKGGLRSALPEGWATYYTPGRQHPFAIHDPTYYGTTTGGVPLTGWISRVPSGETRNASHLCFTTDPDWCF